MNGTTRVDLHCHSVYSDGVLSPGELAEQLAADGVGSAALTDHDSVQGLRGFRQAAARRGIGFIAGVEITVNCRGQEAHLLGYGFDPEHPEMVETLRSLRLARPPQDQSLAGTVRARGSDSVSRSGEPRASSAAPNGQLTITEAIALIHRAGGRAFLAHPLVFEPDLERLRPLIAEMAGDGLDGIEAYYGGHSPAQREHLAELADDLGLLVCGGSDAHERRGYHGGTLGVEMPSERWKRFRDAVCCGPGAGQAGMPPAVRSHPGPRLRRRHFLFHVVFPTFLAIALFVAAIFAMIMPAFERSLLERKREMIRELTNSAWSILASYEREIQAGLLSRAEAQQAAAERIRQLRYGPEGKDYFWLQDLTPRMIMHPYVPELEGRDLSSYEDERGARIFVEFAETVRRAGAGYVDYYWQWKDDPTLTVPKESYVRGFEPWGWIIGTGLYTEDVRREIARIERGLVLTSAAIIAVVALLMLYVLRQSLRLERARRAAEAGLRESTDRYRSLVEATSEGTLVVLDGRCRYANPIMLGLLGASEQELELLDLDDVLPHDDQNQAAWEGVARVLAGRAEESVEGVLRRRDGTLIECVFALSRISFAGRNELIVLARPVGPSAGRLEAGRAGVLPEPEALEAISEQVPAGLLRARLSTQGTVLTASPSAARLLRLPGQGEGEPLSLAALFDNPADWTDFVAEVRRHGAAERRLQLAGAEAARSVALRVVLARDDAGPGVVDGAIVDITLQEKRERERDALIERLQATMLFLHEPVGELARGAVFCALETPVRQVVRAMTSGRATAALVRAEGGEVVGIFTDRDLRERVIAAGVDLSTPVFRVMTSPLVTIPDDAGVYEALLAMESHGVQHLAVEDETGAVVGVVRDRDLLGFPSYGPIVLAREIAEAQTPEEAIDAARRAPGLAKALLDSDAHPDRVTRMLTAVCDAATERFIALAQEQLGPEPVPFAFLALGSHGREELVLSSDQDNAIVYADPAEGTGDGDPGEYFRELGELVCGWLDRAGYPYCTGEIMARNPRWCRPLSAWKGYFAEWLRATEVRQVMEFATFYDFRPVYGSEELAETLRAHVHTGIARQPAFLAYLAQQALVFKPPLRLFGRILVGGSAHEPSGQLDLKDAIIPIVSFARLYALRSGLAQTSTHDRLDALVTADVLTPASRNETVDAYDFLTRLRLQHQAEDLDTDQAPDNLVTYATLDHLERTLLGQAFTQIAAVQRRISHDFLGGAPAP